MAFLHEVNFFFSRANEKTTKTTVDEMTVLCFADKYVFLNLEENRFL